MSGNSSASITLESPKRTSIWMNLPPGTGILLPTWAPNACWYQSAACAAPPTTRCGVIVRAMGELARSVSWFIGSSAQPRSSVPPINLPMLEQFRSTSTEPGRLTSTRTATDRPVPPSITQQEHACHRSADRTGP
jgi:hypothetical protein